MHTSDDSETLTCEGYVGRRADSAEAVVRGGTNHACAPGAVVVPAKNETLFTTVNNNNAYSNELTSSPGVFLELRSGLQWTKTHEWLQQIFFCSKMHMGKGFNGQTHEWLQHSQVHMGKRRKARDSSAWVHHFSVFDSLAKQPSASRLKANFKCHLMFQIEQRVFVKVTISTFARL